MDSINSRRYKPSWRLNPTWIWRRANLALSRVRELWPCRVGIIISDDLELRGWIQKCLFCVIRIYSICGISVAPLSENTVQCSIVDALAVCCAGCFSVLSRTRKYDFSSATVARASHPCCRLSGWSRCSPLLRCGFTHFLMSYTNNHLINEALRSPHVSYQEHS